MDFDTFLDQAWTEHATDAPAVATRLAQQGITLVSEEAQVLPMAHLAHHVFGEHLGRWADGLQFQSQLAALGLGTSDGLAGQAVRRFMASLKLAGGLADERAGLSSSENIRITALAAANLGAHDVARSQRLLNEAMARSDAAHLPDQDPAHRALAIAGNGIAGTLEDKAVRSAAERELMILAAQTGRRYWALAGTWLETERAEYRLAMTWIKAGDAAQARQHAQQCLDIVAAHQGAALEQFFGWEAMSLSERAAGNTAGQAHALQEATAAFAALPESDRGWCQASLNKLQG